MRASETLVLSIYIYMYVYIYIDFRIMLEIQIILQTADVVSGYWEMKKIY